MNDQELAKRQAYWRGIAERSSELAKQIDTFAEDVDDVKGLLQTMRNSGRLDNLMTAITLLDDLYTRMKSV